MSMNDHNACEFSKRIVLKRGPSTAQRKRIQGAGLLMVPTLKFGKENVLQNVINHMKHDNITVFKKMIPFYDRNI